MSLEPYRDASTPERFLRWLEVLRLKFQPPQFTAPTLLNSWVNYSPLNGGNYAQAGYYIDPFGRVHLRGLICNGTTTGGTPVFTLPAALCPTGDSIFNQRGFSSATGNYVQVRIDVKVSGQVQIIDFPSGGATSWVSLAGISFAAV